MKMLVCLLLSQSMSAMQSPKALRQSTFVDMPALSHGDVSSGNEADRSEDFPGIVVVHRGDTPSQESVPGKRLKPIPRTDASSDVLRSHRRASQEIHIHIDKPDTPSTPAPSTEDTEDTIPKTRHNKRMVVSNSISAIVASLATAGVALAVHFSSCKKQ